MEYVFPFIFGGMLMASSKIVSKSIDTKYVPLLGALPTGILTAYFISSVSEQKKYYKSYISLLTVSIIISLLTIVLLEKGYNFCRITPHIILIVLWCIIGISLLKTLKLL